MTLNEQRAAAVARQAAITDAARAEGNRALTAEEQTEFDGLQKQIEGLDSAIAAEAARAQAAPAAPAADPEADRRRAIEGERKRISEITELCRHFNIDPAEHIANGTSINEVRAAVLNQLISRPASAPVTTRVQIVNSGEDDFRRDAADGLMLRGGLHPADMREGARQFAHMTLRDLAIECMEREGHTGARRMNSDDLLAELSRQYLTPTAAFPAILDNAIEKSYIEGHRTAPVTFDRWTRRGTLKDFKVHDNYYLAGPVGEFLLVPEGGELKHDIPTDAKRPTRRLETYGKQFTLSRQAFINDDIDLVTRIPARYARAARKTINTQCIRILLDNPKIYDGQKLFDKTNHRNAIGTGTKPTAESIQNMIMALGTQKDEFGESIIIRPAAMVLPVGYAFDTYGIFNSSTINTQTNTQAANSLFRYRDTIELIEDPTINALCGSKAAPWFLLGNMEDTDFIEVDYLNGQEVPTIRRAEVPGQLGFVWDIWLDWGVTVMDYRGAVQNPGVTITDPLGT